MAIVKADVEGWWDLKTGSGSTAFDSKETGGTNGTITGANWVTGGPTNLPDGLNFDVATEKIVMAKLYDIPDGSVGVWFESDASTGANQTVVGNGNGGGAGPFDIKISNAATDLQGRTRFGVGDTDSNLTTFGYTNLYFALYTWTDDGTPTVQIYVDNVAQTAGTGTGTTATATDNLVIGQRSNETDGLPLNGKVYQVTFFNRVLTSGEVSSLYNSGNGITYLELFSTAYNLPVTVGTFALTGNAVIFTKALSMATAVGTFTLTGIDAVLIRGFNLVADVGSFVLTGIDATLSLNLAIVWTNLTKNIASWANPKSNSSSWSNKNKDTSIWDNKKQS